MIAQIVAIAQPQIFKDLPVVALFVDRSIQNNHAYAGSIPGTTTDSKKLSGVIKRNPPQGWKIVLETPRTSRNSCFWYSHVVEFTGFDIFVLIGTDSSVYINY